MSKVISARAVSVDGYITGRNTFEDSEHFGGGSPHPAARLVVLSHRPAPVSDRHVRLRLRGAVPAPGVTHLHYEVVR
jgi:hypothetical protein